MKVERQLFYILIAFFVIVGIAYGFLTKWEEWTGVLGLFLAAGLSGMIGLYLMVTGRRIGPRPEDRRDGEIYEGAGEQGHFSPWSWWPLVLGLAAGGGFLGLAVGWWIVAIAGGLMAVGIVGWVYEYSRGNHAH